MSPTWDGHHVFNAMQTFSGKLIGAICVDFLDDVMPITLGTAALRRRPHEILKILSTLKMSAAFGFRQGSRQTARRGDGSGRRAWHVRRPKPLDVLPRLHQL